MVNRFFEEDRATIFRVKADDKQQKTGSVSFESSNVQMIWLHKDERHAWLEMLRGGKNVYRLLGV
jgi:hypothetical protein